MSGLPVKLHRIWLRPLYGLNGTITDYVYEPNTARLAKQKEKSGERL